MAEIHLSVVIPCYNEEKTIGNTLLAIDRYLSKQNYFYEIIVVNDGSKDKTAEIAGKFSSLVKNLKLIGNSVNHGKGWGVRQGMLASQGKYRLLMDADNSTTIEHLEKMWPHFERGCSVVIGSRDAKDVKGAKQAVPQSFLKRQMGNLGNLLIQIVAVSGIWDTQCGFKAFTGEAADKIFQRCLVDRWGFDIEALALARKFGYQIGIIPIYWKNRAESRVKLSSYFGVFRDVFKVRWRLMTGVYNAVQK
jgi:dolichyl-phosphate beta-glucosyltransferase